VEADHVIGIQVMENQESAKQAQHVLTQHIMNMMKILKVV
jgi:hypothetical protein